MKKTDMTQTELEDLLILAYIFIVPIAITYFVFWLAERMTHGL